MKKINWKRILPHVWAILIFMVLSVAYFAPVVFGDKTMGQGDVHSWSGQQNESRDCYKQTGEYPHWSNMLFGGMPNIGGEGYNVYNKLFPRFVMGGLPGLNAGILFFYMLGFYILMCVLGCRSWLSILGAVAYAFSTYNLLIIDAGHANKCWAMACMAPILAGVIQCFKGKYLSGALITLIFTGPHIMYSHQQITFYLMFMLVAVAIAYGVQAFRQKQMKTYLKGGVVALAMAVIALLPSLGSWLVTYDYSKDTMRGGAVLKANPDGEKESSGLDIDYAFQWSYGKMESFTLLVPGIYGGSSHYYLSPESNYETTKITGGRQNMVPFYWGDQPFTSGPVYVGAIICFLFILGLFVVKGPEKWWLLAVTVLSLMLSWGRHLSWFNDFLFYHLPLYNRFRTPSMALVIAEISMVALAVLAIKNILESKEKGKYMRDLAYAFGITAGICLFFGLFGKSMFGFVSPADASYPDWLQKTLVEDRASMLVRTAMRSFAFILLAAACLWLYVKKNLKAGWVMGLLAVFVLIDLWTLDRHYVGEQNFVPARSVKAVIPSAIDNMILADTDPDYRVFNVTVNTFNDATTSNFHKSIGGYSPMKLRRYQDIIDYHLSRRLNIQVLNMLNTRYFIAPDASGQPMVQRNVAALGNAWFVDSIRWVNSPDEEIVALYDFDPARVAVIDREWKDKVGMESVSVPVSEADGIRLVQYYPNKLTYEYTASAERPAVFSEVYYKTWKAYVDGEEVPLYRVNYILRGLTLPEGRHVVELRCKNPLIARSKMITNTGSAVNILLILALLGMMVWNPCKKAEQKEA
ncbi:MAG: YfhO family protein [Bacteroides sp.]|nr:YfhO family protein [Bacteroides sp.]MCM1085569.1 YfhO family protein [Bacteroides sp.]